MTTDIKTVKLTVEVPEQLREQMKRKCRENGTFMSAVLPQLVTDYVTGTATSNDTPALSVDTMEKVHEACDNAHMTADQFVKMAVQEYAKRYAGVDVKAVLKGEVKNVPGSAGVRIHDAVKRLIAHNKKAKHWSEKIVITKSVIGAKSDNKDKFNFGTGSGRAALQRYFEANDDAIKAHNEALVADAKNLGLVIEVETYNRMAGQARKRGDS